MKVFKFGGASVNSAEAVRNVVRILKETSDDSVLVVVSAMGKMTNAFERVVHQYISGSSETFCSIDEIKKFHLEIVNSLFPEKSSSIFSVLDELFTKLENDLKEKPRNYDYCYDQIVSFGELISTKIVSEYLNEQGIKNQWLDAREVLITDDTFREGKIYWETTKENVQQKVLPLFSDNKIVVTQGFIASTKDRQTTTLGREGSDYSGAIFAHCLQAESMTIWKDVPGFLNADPKFYENSIKLEQIPYREAIELSYYGATIIHPKTIKPIENKRIPLYVKSFVNPAEEGSVIGQSTEIKPQVPSFIFKDNQILLSISSKDFSFIAEDSLCEIFGIFAKYHIKVNLMQNSAISFSVCIDKREEVFEDLMKSLKEKYKVKYNTNLRLITIRHYTEEVIESIVDKREIIIEQRSRVTAQLVVKS